MINEYTKLDPTLPRIKNMRCPNVDCSSNKKKSDESGESKISEKKPEIIYLRYDNSNMKYIYLCSECNFTWNNN